MADRPDLPHADRSLGAATRKARTDGDAALRARPARARRARGARLSRPDLAVAALRLAHDEDRPGSVPDHVLAHGPENDLLQQAASVRADHDDVRSDVCGDGADIGPGSPRSTRR